MKKFDLHEFFQTAKLWEVDEEEQTQDPNAQPSAQGQPQAPQDPNAQKQQEQPPANQQAPVQTPFDQFSGATIKNIKFEKHENGGSITIDLLSQSGGPKLPLVISWSGDRVTVKHKNITAL